MRQYGLSPILTRYIQARRRPQGHDGQGRHAGHAQGQQNRPGPIVFGPDTEPPLFPAPTTLDEVRPLDPRPVVRGTRESKLWIEFVARYHYLGYKTLVGAQMRYAVHDRNGWPLAMLGVSTAAWKLAPRDTFIGWTRQLREKNLPFVADNPRAGRRALCPAWRRSARGRMEWTPPTPDAGGREG